MDFKDPQKSGKLKEEEDEKKREMKKRGKREKEEEDEKIPHFLSNCPNKHECLFNNSGDSGICKATCDDTCIYVISTCTGIYVITCCGICTNTWAT